MAITYGSEQQLENNEIIIVKDNLISNERVLLLCIVMKF